ncbi:MAG: hypothetical protein VX498_05085 [Myxococcota bacterium]|nr:hypothetical protein [Myxococcota bacterium]
MKNRSTQMQDRARWCLALLPLLFVLGGLPGCGSAEPTACETDLDCLIICECANRDTAVTIGPYPCRSGNCGPAHAEDRDCSRVCATPPAPGPDDDDSAGDDDDSSGG